MRDESFNFRGLALLVWLSPAFPVGAFAYSHGLEWAVEAGTLTGADGAEAWLRDLLICGSARTDAILLAAAYRALNDPATAVAVNDLALALAPSAERHLETTQQGAAFRDAIAASWPHPAFARGVELLDPPAYPVALGLAAAAHGLPLPATLEAFALAFVSNAVSALVRLGPLGQVGAQRVIAALLPVVQACARDAEAATLDHLGSGTLRSDLGSMLHETQYSRLFRS